MYGKGLTLMQTGSFLFVSSMQHDVRLWAKILQESIDEILAIQEMRAVYCGHYNPRDL